MTADLTEGPTSRLAVTNLMAQCGALGAVSIASLVVARSGGPAVVGEYALLRVLPWLFGVVLSSGLPTASAYFLASEHRDDPRLRPTIAAMAVVGGAVALVAWVALSLPMRDLFLRQIPLRLIILMAVTALTQLWTVTAKACCQGLGDITGANTVIVAEELWFVLIYPPMLLLWSRNGIETVIEAMILSGLLATATGMVRLRREGFFRAWHAPSGALAHEIAAYGGRGQLGNVLWLMNLRFDFLLLGALAGPAVLGSYAVASKFAELMRLVPTALNYILYPRYAAFGMRGAGEDARRILPGATAFTILMTPLIATFTFFALPLLYGSAYRGAVLPAEIIIIGLSVEGAAAVASAFLLGCGRPTLNSVGMGAGLVITLSLDLVLIPRYGALGGAITSSIAYLTTTSVLVLLLRHFTRAVTPLSLRRRLDPWAARVAARSLAEARTGGRGPTVSGLVHPPVGAPPGALESPLTPHLEIRRDTFLRRLVDIVVAGVTLVVISPLLALLALAVKLGSRGPAFYTQQRIGRGGRPFTIIKYRSMVFNAERLGPLVGGRRDPRITRVGSWLRRSKLDELPQLLNVLKGDMTLIGPRPEVDRYLPHYGPEELRVLDVRPGLTGAGQLAYTIGVASELDDAPDPEAYYVAAQLHPKLGADLAYLGDRSLARDLGIVFGTFMVVAGRR